METALGKHCEPDGPCGFDDGGTPLGRVEPPRYRTGSMRCVDGADGSRTSPEQPAQAITEPVASIGDRQFPGPVVRSGPAPAGGQAARSGSRSEGAFELVWRDQDAQGFRERRRTGLLTAGGSGRLGEGLCHGPRQGLDPGPIVHPVAAAIQPVGAAVKRRGRGNKGRRGAGIAWLRPRLKAKLAELAGCGILALQIRDMSKPKIIAYLKPTCGWSNGVRAVLRKYDLPYEDRDIINDGVQRQEMIERSGQMLSPCVEVNGVMLADVSGEEVEAYLLAERLVEPNAIRPEVPINQPCANEMPAAVSVRID
jgi:glutaredoxin